MSIAAQSLRLIVVAGSTPDHPISLDAVAAALRGGATMIQLRGKGLADHRILETARSLLLLCDRAGVPLFINDRPDLALAAGAAGAHVGPDDLPPAAARQVLGDRAGLGVSARTPDRVRQAEAAGADYLGTGALHTTPTKPEARVLGPKGIAEIVTLTRIPVVAIGGVRPQDIPHLKTMGVAGVAVMSGILQSENPETAARTYRKAWTQAP